ncbi:MAG: hypothetical protein QXI12_11920 [Candidatus Methanomethyliaceae archaeon]
MGGGRRNNPNCFVDVRGFAEEERCECGGHGNVILMYFSGLEVLIKQRPRLPVASFTDNPQKTVKYPIMLTEMFTYFQRCGAYRIGRPDGKHLDKRVRGGSGMS